MKTFNLHSLRIEPLEKMIGEKLGIPITFDKEVVKRRGTDFIQLTSQNIVSHVGVLSNIFNRVQLHSFSGGEMFVGVKNESEKYLWFTISFRYSMIRDIHNGTSFASCYYYPTTNKWVVYYEGDKADDIKVDTNE